MSEQAQPQVISDRSQQSFNNESYITIRLDTDKILRKLELFLRSQRIVLKQDPNTNLLYEDTAQLGTPLCNEQGVNGILQITELMVNPMVVQGNFDQDQYGDYCYYARKELASEIITNRIKWGISSENTRMIIDSIMRFVKPFMSRLIDNLERESYIGGFQSREVIVQGEQKKSMLGLGK